MNSSARHRNPVYRCLLCKRAVEFQKLKDGTYKVVDAGQYVSVVTDDGAVVRGRTMHEDTCPFAPAFHGTARENQTRAAEAGCSE